MDKKQLGIYGELIAARYLRRHGYEILKTNFHSRFGEIDLIAQKKETVVFVEVKTRDANSLERPASAVTPTKQQRIKKTALYYLFSMDKEVNVSFDVVEVLVFTKGIKKVKINHIISAFE